MSWRAHAVPLAMALATILVPACRREASIVATVAHSGKPRGVTFFQVLPPSRVTCTRPSSEPAQSSPGASGDSARAKIVQ